jgi:Cu+-exporting ATPase
MTCTACARRVEKTLNKIEGVSAYVDFATETAHVSSSKDQLDRETLVEAVRDAGYEVGSNRGELTMMIWRLVIGALIAIPVAVISMFHELMPPNWNLTAAVLTFPVAFWVSWPFHAAAYKNLKLKTATMDTLVSLGVLVSYLYSVSQVFTGSHEVYFEVAAVVPVVVLFGRWLEVRTRRSATDSVKALLSAIPETAVVRKATGQETVLTSLVELNDLVIVATGQRIPVDGEIVEGWSQIDNSLITGESVPVDVSIKSMVAAGSLNIGSALVIRTTAVSASSRIAQIADLVREATAHKTKIGSITDRISAVFVPAVIVLAILTLLFWSFVLNDPAEGLSAAIAVLVIACPCALGIAVPMSLVVATSLGAKQGIVIRNPDTLSLLSKVTKVVLDKTGTLTTGVLEVTKTIAIADTDKQTAIAFAAAVERSSAHPLAKAIAALDSSKTASDVKEIAGYGVTGIVEGKEITVTRSQSLTVSNRAELDKAITEAGQASIVVVSWDNQARLVIALSDAIRSESFKAIKNLQDLDVEPILLSGDNQSRVAAVAKELEIASYFGEVTPEEKLNKIRSLKQDSSGNKSVVAMVGDGLNDVAALAGADVGIAMGSGTHAAQSAAAITIVDDNPVAIPFALSLAKRTWANVKQNLVWAFGYNVVLIPVAAMGLLNPMFAGAAMAFSSISVVLNALRLHLINPKK